MVDSSDHEALESARLKVGLSAEALWIRYFELGGEASFMELEAFLKGALVPTTLQRDVVAQAINEAFMDKGSDERVVYKFGT